MTRAIGEHHFKSVPVWRWILCYDELMDPTFQNGAASYRGASSWFAQFQGGSGYRIDYALVGYLTQALYDYQNKYFLRTIVATVLHVLRRDPLGVPGVSTGKLASTSRWLSPLTLKTELWCAGK